MIFTIGHKKSYQQYFIEQGTPQKAGRDNPNCTGREGGSVWQTFDGAYRQAVKHGRALDSEYAVYGVKADWETQTAPSPTPNAEWHQLLVDADLVDLSKI